MFVRLFAPPRYLTGVILGTVRIWYRSILCPTHGVLGYSDAHHRIFMDRWPLTSDFQSRYRMEYCVASMDSRYYRYATLLVLMLLVDQGL